MYITDSEIITKKKEKKPKLFSPMRNMATEFKTIEINYNERIQCPNFGICALHLTQKSTIDISNL